MTLPPTAQTALDHRLAVAQAEHRYPSVVAGVLRDGELIWSGGAGEVDGAFPGADTQYRIGSITKTFIGAAIAQLAERGYLDLRDDVLDHLGADWTDQPQLERVRIGDLLAHTSGLGSETAGPWWERTDGGGEDELAQMLMHACTDGTHHYSNAGFGVLGAVLAHHHHKTWDAVIDDEFLAPLGMTRTTSRPSSNAAAGYAVHPHADAIMPEPEHDAGAMAPAGQFWSTINDMATWAAFLSGRGGDDILSAETRELMRRPGPVSHNVGEPWVSAQGLGVQLRNRDRALWVGHGGSMPGFLAGLWIRADNGVGWLTACNTTAFTRTSLGDDLVELAAEHLPVPPTPWTPAPIAEETADLLGVWYWGPGMYTIAQRGELLELRPVAAGRGSRFQASGTDEWLGLDDYYQGEPLRIVRNGDGSISHLDLSSFIFTREPYAPAEVHPGGRIGDWS